MRFRRTGLIALAALFAFGCIENYGFPVRNESDDRYFLWISAGSHEEEPVITVYEVPPRSKGRGPVGRAPWLGSARLLTADCEEFVGVRSGAGGAGIAISEGGKVTIFSGRELDVGNAQPLREVARCR